jgi:hypothetical protein
MAAAREACEIQGLLRVQDYLVAARAGASFDSLGPLLALSLVDAAGGFHGAGIFGSVAELARAMRGVSACELLTGAVRGFAKSGDHQSVADTLELVNIANTPGTWGAVN